VTPTIDQCRRAASAAPADRAMRLIADGVLDRDGPTGLARRVGCPADQLDPLLRAEFGAGAAKLADAHRTELEHLARPGGADPDVITVELPYRPPYDAAAMWRFLAARAIAGLEELAGPVYRRALRLPRGPGVAELTPANGHVVGAFRLADRRDLAPAVARSRRLLHLDADPDRVTETLGADPLLGPLVRARPGLRVPGSADPYEIAVRAIIGQQVSVSAARTVAGRMVGTYGTPLPMPVGGVTHTFPTPQTLAEVPQLPMPRSRVRTITALATAVADATIDLEFGADWTAAVPALLAFPGIGSWTAEYVALRGLGDPDAFPGTDLGIRYALVDLGVPDHGRTISDLADRWRPLRSYAAQYLWTHLGDRGG
jgi:AraC family transcriptional regulator of adaptative response / DNA-3-methyladenine glycosylase II